MSGVECHVLCLSVAAFAILWQSGAAVQETQSLQYLPSGSMEEVRHPLPGKRRLDYQSCSVTGSCLSGSPGKSESHLGTSIFLPKRYESEAHRETEGHLNTGTLKRVYVKKA